MLYDEKDVFASPIVYPTVPKGTARIRLMPSAVHTDADIKVAVDAFTDLGKKLHII